MLSILLDNHPDIFVSAKAMGPKISRLESLIMKNYETVGARRDGNFLRMLTESLCRVDDGRWANLLRYAQMPGIGLKSVTIRDYLLSCFEAEAKAHKKIHWCDKCPEQIADLPTLRALFPRAKFLHVIRDGRAVGVSQRDRQYVDMYLAILEWKRKVLKARFHGSYFGPESYLEVRYESLLEQPVVTCEEICRFLGVPFHAEMLRLTDHRDVSVQGAYVLPKIDRSKIDSWREKVNHRQIGKMERIAGDTLQDLGYQLEEPLTGRDFKMHSLEALLRRQKDLVRALFMSHRRVMKDRRIVDVYEGRGRRLRRFASNTLRLWLSTDAVAVLTGRHTPP